MSFFTGRNFRRNYVASASRTLRSACAPTVEAMERRTLLSATLEVGTGHPFSTIQAALDAAAPGDTVLVSPGTYTENVTISKSLTLLSTGGRDDTTIQGISGAGASAKVSNSGLRAATRRLRSTVDAVPSTNASASVTCK